MKRKNILIVGGAGFIGSNINKILQQSGYNTIVYDNLSKGSRQAVVCGTFIEGDLNNQKLLEQVMAENKVDVAMHFAAWTDVGESVINPAKYYQNNVVNTLTLLNAMIKCQVPIIIFSSSAAIFGNPQTKSISEEHICKPLNPYGATKLMVEKIIEDYHAAYGLKACCLRYFNAAGGDPDGEVKNFKEKENNLIPIILRNLIAANPVIKVFGTDYPTKDGTCVRDYVHVYDLAKAHILGMERLMQGADLLHYNLGNGTGFTVNEVIAAVENTTNQKIHIIPVERRAGDPAQLVANAEKAKNELGWHCKYPDLETMIKHAWQAMLL